MEHRIVKNLLFVWGNEKRQWADRTRGRFSKLRKNYGGIGGEEDGEGIVYQAYDQVWWTVGMLNESLGLCLR